MGCERFKNMMAGALYGDLDDATARELDEHLAGCNRCAAELDAMRATLDVMNRRERENPGRGFWDGYWDRLAGRMQDEGVTETGPSWWRRRVGSPGRWAYRVAAAAAILTVGIFAGRTIFAPEVPVTLDTPVVAERPVEAPPEATPSPGEDEPGTDAAPEQVAEATPEPREETPAVEHEDAPAVARGEDAPPEDTTPMAVQPASSDRAMRYVQKSQLLLVALVNNDPSAPDGYASDFGVQQERSRRLVSEASSIKEELDDPKQRQLRELVTELEKILLQISNLESEDDVDAVEFIRSRVNDHDVLLKINLEQMRRGADVDEGASGEDRGNNSQRSIW